MQKANPIKLTVILCSICLSFISMQVCHAQSGQFLQFWGGPQYVGMLNFNDNNTTTTTTPTGAVVFTSEETTIETYRWGGGVDYINNYTQNYGFQTGLYYSGQGQKYGGWLHDFYDHKDSLTTFYTSEAILNYIRVPFFFRFNSILDEADRINVSIFMGFQAGYLFGVASYTTPNTAPDSVLRKYSNFNFKQLYTDIDLGLGAGAQFNIRLTQKLSINFGVRFDRSILNIENHNYVLPADAPVQWLYPLSTDKSSRDSHDDVVVRPPTQNISVNAFLGLSVKLKDGKPPKPHPTDDLPPEQP